VAKDEDRVVGCLLLEMHSTLKAFVRALCVSSENRGRGVGADLLAFAEHRAFKETANVFLFVSSDRAKHFYESNGYKEVGCLENLNITGIHEWIMRKTIGPADEISRIQ
jgi:ribosomal protein S18 acetylase RimI-like enzyme